MAKKGDYQIPFDQDGNQQHYPEHWYVGEWPNGTREGPHWRDNVPFDDTLTFAGYTRGRSAAYFRFTCRNGKHVYMFLTDLQDAIPHMLRGELCGTFQFIKRGQNYGVQLVQAAP